MSYVRTVCGIYNKVSAIRVPATAGTHERRRVSGLNGRKGCVDGLCKTIALKAIRVKIVGASYLKGYMRLIGDNKRNADGGAIS